MRLVGRTAIVTGAASGIGRASALLFAKEGASVALVDRDAAGLQETFAAIAGAKGGTSVHVGDVGAADASSRMKVNRPSSAFLSCPIWAISRAAAKGAPGISLIETGSPA